MSFRGVEVEVTVECGKGHNHSVRLRYHNWDSDAFEVIHNPCQEKLGPQLGEMAPCVQTLQDKKWRIWESSKYQLIERLAGISDPQVIPMLLGALQDESSYISFLAADLLGNFSGNTEAAGKLIDILRGAIEDICSGYMPSSRSWRQLLASCAALAKMRVQDNTILARLRSIFLDLAIEYYKQRVKKMSPAYADYALRAVGAVLSLTGNACDAPLLYSTQFQLPRLHNDSSSSDSEIEEIITLRQMQQYWQNSLNG